MIDEYANGNLGNLSEPDVLVSHDYLRTQLRTLPAQPEHVLLAAVLRDAIETFQRLYAARRAASKRLFRESEEWIWSDESDRVFSFIHICEMLGLDPGYIRRGLRRWIADRQHEANLLTGDRDQASAHGPSPVRVLRRDRAEERQQPANPRVQQRIIAGRGGDHRRRAVRKDAVARYGSRRFA